MEQTNAFLTPEQLDAHRLEIENRVRNLFWTVSGDYTADIRPDVEAYRKSPKLALYNAVKQGAFQKYFDPEALALYTVKKCARGAAEGPLMELTQLCVDTAVYPLVSTERSGIAQLRRDAFTLLLDDAPASALEKLRQCVIRRFLGLPELADPEIRQQALEIDRLSRQADTDSLIATVDAIYNTLLDPDFAQRGGSLEAVMAVTPAELVEYQRFQELSDGQIQAVLESYLSKIKDALLSMTFTPPARHRFVPQPEADDDIPEPEPEAREKVYAYMQRQFGKSYLSPLEQARITQKLCTGMHKRCTLYFTEGILSNPVMKSTQFLRTRMQEMKNDLYFNTKKQAVGRSVHVLSSRLKQAQILRLDEDAVRSEYGQIRPAQLWKVGRSSDSKLFESRKKRERSDFVVDILLDGSSSQTQRQPQLAVQAYIISQALSEAGISHRVSSFCSYWDYTILHRFRNYDDSQSSNRNVLQFRAFGENRDGLAIRTVCEELSHRGEEKKILIVLSDGRPSAMGLMRPGTWKPAPYVGEAAIRDTAFEVRKARNRGISVLGIFVGKEEDLGAERKIYGKEFIYTRSINSFAHIVGAYLRKQIEQD